MFKRTIYIWLAIFSVFLVACGGEGINLPQSPLLSTLERKSGLIAYIGLDGNIYTIDQSGGKLTALTDDAHPQPEGGGITRFYNFPTWSQHDRSLAYLGITVEENGDARAQIHAGPIDKEAEVIFDSEDDFPFYLYWSPDGENLSFLSRGITGGSMALQVVTAEGDDSFVVDTGTPYYWAWSPNESQVFVHVGGAASLNPGEARLSFLSLGQNITETGLNLLPSAFQAPVFSPEGEYIIVAAEDRAGVSSLVLAKANGDVQSILADIGGPVAFDWSPKGDHLAYIENTQSTSGFLGNLKFVNLDDPEFPEVIETDAENVIAFFWSPEGDKVVYFVPAIVNQSDDESTGNQDPMVFLIMYIANAIDGSTREVTSFLPSDAFLNILPFFDQYQRSATIWSPDGNYLVVSALSNSDGTPGIFVVPSAGSLSPRFLIEGSLAFWSWE